MYVFFFAQFNVKKTFQHVLPSRNKIKEETRLSQQVSLDFDFTQITRRHRQLASLQQHLQLTLPSSSRTIFIATVANTKSIIQLAMQIAVRVCIRNNLSLECIENVTVHSTNVILDASSSQQHKINYTIGNAVRVCIRNNLSLKCNDDISVHSTDPRRKVQVHPPISFTDHSKLQCIFRRASYRGALPMLPFSYSKPRPPGLLHVYPD